MINGFRTILRGKIGFENAQPPLPHSEHASTALKGAEFGRVGRLIFCSALWGGSSILPGRHHTKLVFITSCNAPGQLAASGTDDTRHVSYAGDYNI